MLRCVLPQPLRRRKRGLYVQSNPPFNDNSSPPFAAATSFCKCTCFTNSTIIALDGSKPATTSRAGLFARAGDPKKGSGTCASCNKKFCLDYNLPICKDATENDVTTSCFRTFCVPSGWTDRKADRGRRTGLGERPGGGVGVHHHHGRAAGICSRAAVGQ